MRLNYRFESDVPPPPMENKAPAEERNPAVQTDFDQNRPQEILDRTLASPNNERVLAIYHNVSDLPAEFRLDMYAADGRRLKTITHEGMAVHFPDTIVWSPDSTSVAFVAMVRTGKLGDFSNGPEGPQTSTTPPSATPEETPTEADTETPDANSGSDANAGQTPGTPPAGEEPPLVLTFRTEQIYLCDANGGDLKPLTQNEGLIYFYFVWSPDSSALAALAAKFTEWRIWKYQADQSGQIFRPAGRPRIVEKTGRQRLLDDYPTLVHPVWSPDSAKVAAAFDKQVRIYDAIGNAPTQAAVLLRNQLLVSSKAYDEAKRKEMGEAPAPDGNSENSNNPTPETNGQTNSNTANANVVANLPEGVLPDERTLISFNPIVDLKWTEDAILYLETAYVREFQDSTNNVRSNSRWHRLIFSPQAIVLGNQQQQ